MKLALGVLGLCALAAANSVVTKTSVITIQGGALTQTMSKTITTTLVSTQWVNPRIVIEFETKTKTEYSDVVTSTDYGDEPPLETEQNGADNEVPDTDYTTTVPTRTVYKCRATEEADEIVSIAPANSYLSFAPMNEEWENFADVTTKPRAAGRARLTEPTQPPAALVNGSPY